jgi:hypothetical protein
MPSHHLPTYPEEPGQGVISVHQWREADDNIKTAPFLPIFFFLNPIALLFNGHHLPRDKTPRPQNLTSQGPTALQSIRRPTNSHGTHPPFLKKEQQIVFKDVKAENHFLMIRCTVLLEL